MKPYPAPARPPGRVDGTVVVTGGTGALGRAVVADLLDAGARVASTWVSASEAETLAAELGEPRELELVEADLLTDAGESALAGIAGRGIAGLVNLAGGFAAGERADVATDASWQRMLDLNLWTAIRATRACLPALAATARGAGDARASQSSGDVGGVDGPQTTGADVGGSAGATGASQSTGDPEAGATIVCVASKAAREPFPGGVPYAVSKAAVEAFARAIDAEWREEGVRCNAVLPSIIDTPANREAMPSAEHSRWVPPEEVARVVRFLCSPDSAPTSGAAIPVYGRS